jgi:hypothetical protein
VALVAVGGSVACSLYLDWDREGLPCDTDKKCYEGYSCLVNRCVLERSLPLGETCSEDIQCDGEDSVCGSNPFTCRTSCSAFYKSTSTCDTNLYCRPDRTAETQTAPWEGTCFPSECSRDEDCGNDRQCVPIELDAGACLQACEYQRDSTSGAYTDTCAITAQTVTYCQPLGLQAKERLVCLELVGDDNGNEENGLCEPVVSPCKQLDGVGVATGLVCVNGQCRKLCDSASKAVVCTAPNLECCPVEGDGGGPVYSVCKQTC